MLNHNTILLEKLKTIGFTSSVLDWFCSYLSNRTQVTMINSSMSQPKSVTVGVPQGSIGPLLFLIYINDLPECLTHCKSILYADDTLLYYTLQKVLPNYSQNSTSTYDPCPVILTTTSLHSIMTRQSSSFSPVDNINA